MEHTLFSLSFILKYGTVTDTMDITRTGEKGIHLNTLEQYHIYKINRKNLHMKDIYFDIFNPIFMAFHEIYHR
jgi:hypothetical protein